MNPFRRNSALELSSLIKSSELRLHSSHDNLMKDFSCSKLTGKPTFIMPLDNSSPKDLINVNCDKKGLSIVDSLSVANNPFEKFVKEEFRYQNESVRRLSLEIFKDVLHKRPSLNNIKTNSNQIVLSNYGVIPAQILEVETPPIIEKNQNIFSIPVSQAPETKISYTPKLSKRENNIFAPITF